MQWTRRNLLSGGLITLWMPRALRAGEQAPEVLSDAVRSALKAAVTQAPLPLPVHTSAQMAQLYEDWLQRNEQRLQAVAQGIPNQESSIRDALASVRLRRAFLQTVWYESQRAGLEPALVLGLIHVESGFRQFAISQAGARGYMQVMPFWTQQLADGDASVLFQLQTNLRFGCVILRHYLDLEHGDLTLALGRYNGSRGQGAYPQAVLTARQKWL